MKKAILTSILAGALALGACAPKYDVSKVSENVKLTKPQDCQTVKDIRYVTVQGGSSYQMLCINNDKLVLYDRAPSSTEWTKIEAEDK